MSAQYALLLSDPLSLAESFQAYHFLTERHLQALWLEQKYLKNLKSSLGEDIQVISPGYWNTGAGPDFLKAHLKIGSLELKGDIEIHLDEDSWLQHGHHADERYNNVILHVSLWKPESEKKLPTYNGKEFHRVYLEDFLTVPQERLMKLIDLDLYPYKEFVGSGKCAHTLFNKIEEEKILSFFKQAAYWRLEEKRKFLKSDADNIHFEFLTGVAAALGYKNNAEVFRHLFFFLSKHPKKTEEEKLALAMEACGFFDENYKKKWGDSQKFRSLASLSANSLVSPPSFKLSLHQIRPLNHPIRRFVTLVKLLSSLDTSHLYEQLADCWSELWHQTIKNKWKQLLQQLNDVLPNYKDSYWSRHYLFEKAVQIKPLPLLGETIKHEILVNVFFPLLHDDILSRNDPRQLQAFYEFYESLPSSCTGKTQYLSHRFFGNTSKKTIFKHACTEQGAYQLHKDFCIHFEASCQGCPFVEKFKTLFPHENI